MSSLSSFSSSTNPTTEFSRWYLSNGQGTLSTFSNSSSGYLYGIQFGVLNTYFQTNPDPYPSGLTLNTAISGQANSAITFTSGTLYQNTKRDMHGFRLMSNYDGSEQGDLAPATGAYLPIESRFSGATTIYISSATDVANAFYAILWYDLD